MSLCIWKWDTDGPLYAPGQLGTANANGVQRSPGLGLPFGFGDVFVNDWVILDAPEPNANVIADARGINVNADQAAGVGYHSSLSLVFKSGR